MEHENDQPGHDSDDLRHGNGQSAQLGIGHGGNDVLLGGPGRDTAFGVAGNDQLRGDDGPTC